MVCVDSNVNKKKSKFSHPFSLSSLLFPFRQHCGDSSFSASFPFFSSELQLAISMELQSCKVSGSSYCTWYDSDNFYAEDMDVNKVLPLAKTHLQWCVERISKLLQGSSNRFFIHNDKDDSRTTRLSKFRDTTSWVMRCTVWPKIVAVNSKARYLTFILEINKWFIKCSNSKEDALLFFFFNKCMTLFIKCSKIQTPERRYLTKWQKQFIRIRVPHSYGNFYVKSQTLHSPTHRSS